MTEPRIAVIYCGGTIGMLPTKVGGLGFVADAKADQLSLRNALMQAGLPSSSDWFPVRAFEPSPRGAAVELPLIDSSAVDAYYWQCLVATILELPAAYDAVLILHGTDTMAYTAAALSIALAAADFSRPIVITGSQRPIRTAGGELDCTSDGVANIRDAVTGCRAAVTSATNLDGVAVPLVQLVFAGAYLHGARCSKVHSEHDCAFSERQVAINEQSPLLKKTQKSVGDVTAFCSGVADIVINPGLEAYQLAHMLSAPGLRASVVRLYGSGTISSEHISALPVGIPLLAVSACFEGGIQADSYEASAISGVRSDNSDHRSGFINGRAMSPEMAVAKLMWVMAEPLRARDFIYWLTVNVAGELS